MSEEDSWLESSTVHSHIQQNINLINWSPTDVQIGHGWLRPPACDSLLSMMFGCFRGKTTFTHHSLCETGTNHPTATIEQPPPPPPPPRLPLPPPPPLSTSVCTDLSLQVHVCNAVEGKLVSVSAVLVDVGEGQTRQLLHRLVVTGHRGEFGRHQRGTLGVHGRQEGGQQQEHGGGLGGHDGSGSDRN